MHNAGVIHGYARVSTGRQDLTASGELEARSKSVFREKMTGSPPSTSIAARSYALSLGTSFGRSCPARRRRLPVH